MKEQEANVGYTIKFDNYGSNTFLGYVFDAIQSGVVDAEKTIVITMNIQTIRKFAQRTFETRPGYKFGMVTWGSCCGDILLKAVNCEEDTITISN
jgi:hypothetical protein